MNNYYGGKLISIGSRTCIFNPSVKCKNIDNIRDKNKISKIFFKDTNNEESKKEKKISDIIKKLPNYKKWAIVYDIICEIPNNEEFYKMDNDISKCLNKMRTVRQHDVDKIDENSYMLIGDSGGITYDKYFKKNFIPKKNLEKKFLILMKKIKNIFIGLIELNKNNIAHLDIKENNILLSNGVFKLIDFGLSDNFNNINHFKKRSFHEFNRDHIYIWYPPEYIFFYIDKDNLEDEINEIYDNYNDIDYYRKNSSKISDIYKILLSLDFKEYLLNLLIDYKNKNNTLEEYKQLIKKIDCYSLGMMIIKLFYSNDLLDSIRNNNKMINNFFNLFKLMINPNHKERIDIIKAYKIFNILLNKYLGLNKNKNKTKRKNF